MKATFKTNKELISFIENTTKIEFCVLFMGRKLALNKAALVRNLKEYKEKDESCNICVVSTDKENIFEIRECSH